MKTVRADSWLGRRAHHRQLGVAVVSAIVFAVSTRRAAVPVIEPQMFNSRVFTAANVSVVIAAAIFGMQVLGMGLFLQQVWHWSTQTPGWRSHPDRRRL